MHAAQLSVHASPFFLLCSAVITGGGNHDGKVDYIPEPLVVESQHACPRCALLKDIRVAVARDAVASRYLFALTSDLAFLCI